MVSVYVSANFLKMSFLKQECVNFIRSNFAALLWLFEDPFLPQEDIQQIVETMTLQELLELPDHWIVENIFDNKLNQFKDNLLVCKLCEQVYSEITSFCPKSHVYIDTNGKIEQFHQ